MNGVNVSWPGWDTVRLIGRGSFGAVYEIQRKIFNETEKAALKVITIPQNDGDIDEMRSDGFDDESITATFHSHLESIVGEYSTMHKMNGSANVVNCDDVHYEPHADGIGWDVYIKMELLTPLAKSLPNPIPEATVVKVGRDICAALELCRKYDVVHRDIKPQNIFLSNNGDYKLGDFGIAKTVEKTMGGTKIGTYKYMAPEVYNNQPYGTSADIYSLGLVLYWMLNERRMPFMPMGRPTVGDDEEARRRRFDGEPIPAPKNGSEELKQIVLKACAFDPKDRFASAAQMLQALRNLGGVGVGPAPVTESVAEKENDEFVNGDATVGPELGAANDSTVGPAWNGTVHEETEENDQTVGPFFNGKKTENVRSNADSGKKRLLRIAAIGAAVMIIILLLKSCFGGTGMPAETEPDETITTEVTETQTDPPITEPKETLPVQLEWSEWMEELPEYVDNTVYDVEEQMLYRSRNLETTSSTTSSTMDGWDFVKTEETVGEYGAWSAWSDAKVTATDNREVESQTRYRYRTKETTTSTSSTKSGWTLYDTTYGWSDYGSWSSWSTTKATASNSRQVESKTQYRYADKLTTTSSSSSLSGWTQYDSSTSWSDWGSWSGWSSTVFSGSDSRQVETASRYQYYAFICSRCGARIPYKSGTSYGICYTELGGCGSTSYSHSTDITFLTNPPSDATLWAYNKRCLIVNGLRWYINTGTDPMTVYRYRDRSQITTYYYWKWDSWSSWSDSKFTASDTRKVETRTVYRYRDREQVSTYHFYRWGGWSDWSTTAVSEKDNRQVESAKYYRYRDRPTVQTHYFQRWTDWTEFLPAEVTETETTEVETKQQFRFRSRTSEGDA